MKPLTWDENMVGTFIPSGGVEDITAVTVTEVGGVGAVDLSSYIRKNGVTWPSGRGSTDTATIDRKQNTTYPGSESGTLDITFLKVNRQGLTEAADLFAGGEVEGFWVMGLEGSNTVADDPYDGYHVVGDRPVPNNPGPDEQQMFTVRFHLQDSVAEAAVIVAAA